MKSSGPSLSKLLTQSQEEQLARLLAEVMALGFGSLTIEVVEHQPRFFRSTKSFKAPPCADQLEDREVSTADASQVDDRATNKIQGG